jgi:hypothetical protein
MVTLILMIIGDIITKILIQYHVHFLNSSINLRMESGTKF